MAYLLLDEFSGEICTTPSAYDGHVNQYPFLEYAAGCWDAHAQQCPDADDVFELSMEFLASNTFTPNFMNYLQARDRSAVDFHSDKPPLSLLTNARLTWMLKRMSTNAPDWYNEELGAHGTPLTNAVFRNDVDMINILIDAGVDINKPIDYHVHAAGVTPLYIATASNHSEAFEILLQRGADVNKPHTFTFDTVLHEVCRQGRLDKAKRLLEIGSKINCRNHHGLTPLHSAIQGGSLEVVKLLVNAGAEIVDRVEFGSGMGSGKTAVHYALELRSEAIIECLLNHCDDLGHLQNLSLHQIRWAEKKPWFARLRRAIASGSGFEQQDSPRFFTATDVLQTRCILQDRLKLPSAVTAVILDYAEYWVRRVGMRDELWVVDQGTPEHPYVQIIVPGWGGVSPVRRVIFRTRSHDQGKPSIVAVILENLTFAKYRLQYLPGTPWDLPTFLQLVRSESGAVECWDQPDTLSRQRACLWDEPRPH